MDPRGIKKCQKMAWDGQGRAGMGRALGALESPFWSFWSGPGKTAHSPLPVRQFWTHFWSLWHHFEVFFRSCFSTRFRDRFFKILASFWTLFWHHFQIIFVSVFVSLENVISETPTREINGFAFWNVVRNMIKLGPKPGPKIASKKNTKMREKGFKRRSKMMTKSIRERFFRHPKFGPISEGSEFRRSRSDYLPPPTFLKSGPSREDQEGKVSHAGTILLKQRSADL